MINFKAVHFCASGFSFATGLVFFAAVGSYAQAEDLMDVYKLAQQNDTKYLAAGFSRAASNESISQAMSKYLPTVSFDAERTETNQDILSSDNTVFASGTTSFPTTQYTLTVSQPIFQWASIVGIRQAKSTIKLADAEYQQAHQDLVLRTVERYLEVLKAEDSLASSEAEKKSVKKQFELVTAQKKAGSARLTDLLDAKARSANADAAHIGATYAVKDAFDALMESTGQILTSLSSLKDTIPLTSPESATVDERVAQALKNNPGMIAQQNKLDVARQEVERQKAGHYPTLDLVARGNRRNTGGTLFGGGSEVETTDIMLRLNVPLYQGGYTSSRSREAQQLFFQAKEELEEFRRGLSRQTRSAYFGVMSAIQRVEALKRSLDAQEATLDSKKTGYRYKKYTNLAVLDAERDLSMAKNDFSAAKHDYLLNALRLEHAIGDLSVDDIERINGWFE